VIALAIGTSRDRKPDPPIAPTAATFPPAPVPRKSFVLLIDSTPNGADVREGDRVLGTTPMQLSIDNDAVRAEPRKLTVQREGFQRYSILQGASEDNVRVIASLVPQQPAEGPALSAKSQAPAPLTAHVVKPTPKSVPPPPEPPPAPTTPPPALTPAPGDIRLQR
jgi:serine/threonine-protein kinase